MNIVDNDNTEYNSDYSSTDDNCVAMIAKESTELIASHNLKIKIANYQVTHLPD